MKGTRTLLKRAMAPVAIAGVLLVGASAAYAAGSFDVTAGSATTGTDVDYSATTLGSSPQVTFRDLNSGTTLNCASATAAGYVTVGPNQDGDAIGKIDGPSTVWNTCTGPFGLVLTVTGAGTWNIDATGSTASGVTPGKVSNIQAHVAGACNFDVTGTVVTGSYTNGTSTSDGVLSLPGTETTATSQLVISNVSGALCGLAGIANGHVASFEADYGVPANVASYNPIEISGTYP